MYKIMTPSFNTDESIDWNSEEGLRRRRELCKIILMEEIASWGLAYSDLEKHLDALFEGVQ